MSKAKLITDEKGILGMFIPQCPSDDWTCPYNVNGFCTIGIEDNSNPYEECDEWSFLFDDEECDEDE